MLYSGWSSLLPLLCLLSRTKRLLEKFPVLSIMGGVRRKVWKQGSSSAPGRISPVYRVGLFFEIIGLEI